MKCIAIEEEDVVSTVCAEDVVDPKTGEVMLQVNETLTAEKLEIVHEKEIEEFKILFIDELNVNSYLHNTLLINKMTNEDKAILEIYHRLQPNNPPTLETARNLFFNLFFNTEHYDLS